MGTMGDRDGLIAFRSSSFSTLLLLATINLDIRVSDSA